MKWVQLDQPCLFSSALLLCFVCFETGFHRLASNSEINLPRPPEMLGLKAVSTTGLGMFLIDPPIPLFPRWSRKTQLTHCGFHVCFLHVPW